MSVQALSCAFALRGLAPSEKLVLLALANFANEKMQCWPSQERLAADTELSSRTVWSALKSLEGKGVLQRTSRTRQDGSRATDIFTLYFSLEVWSEPVADFASTHRNSCEPQSQPLQAPVATVATPTTFEPSLEPSKEPDGEPPGFVEWWEAYPKKVSKGSARKAYRSALKKAKSEIMLAALVGYPFAPEAKFIPHPATWLNGECWADNPPGPQPDPDPWRPRLLNWRVNRYWNSEWGPKPGDAGYRGPSEPEARAA